jgi:hypothetical protein
MARKLLLHPAHASVVSSSRRTTAGRPQEECARGGAIDAMPREQPGLDRVGLESAAAHLAAGAVLPLCGALSLTSACFCWAWA